MVHGFHKRYVLLPAALLAILLTAMFFWPVSPPHDEDIRQPHVKLPPQSEAVKQSRLETKNPENHLLKKEMIIPAERVASVPGYVRVEPRPPLSDLAAPARPAAASKPLDRKNWKNRRLFRPVVQATNLIEVQGFRIQLAGIDVAGLKTSCRKSSSAVSPCGMQARTALRRWIRARAIECKLPPEALKGDIVTSCSLAGEDIATWLARHGWLLSSEDRKVSLLIENARRAGRGLYAFDRIQPE